MIIKQILKGLAIVGLAASFIACDDATTADPGTASRNDLNPPGSLETVTGDGELTLWWTAGNVEEDFKGYYVFAAKSATPGAYSYPAGADVNSVGIPRCYDNSAFFEAFGLPAIEEGDRECEGATEEAADDAEAFGLQDADDAAAEDGDGPLKNWIPCKAGGDANLSLTGTVPTVTMQNCTISKYYDGTGLADMSNGETYMFFVVAVMGDDFSKISWTTPLVEDSPSSDILPAKDITLETNKYLTLKINNTADAWTAEVSDSVACGGAAACGLSSTNAMAETDGAPTIYIGRQEVSASTDSTYDQRLFISASTAGVVKIQPRGPQTNGGSTRIAGDEAASTFPDAGTKYIVYQDQIFDFQITTTDNETYVGKVHIDTVAFAGSAKTGDATIKVAVVFQPGNGVNYYATFE